MFLNLTPLLDTSFSKILLNHWIPCLLLSVATTCLLHSFYKRKGKAGKIQSKDKSLLLNPGESTGPHTVLDKTIGSLTASQSPKKSLRYQKGARRAKPKKLAFKEEPSFIRKTKQRYEVFLVMDIEGTCKQGTDFDYPNEIIELPVSVLQWADREDDGSAATLVVADEFRTFVKPSWRPTLSDFCTQLTGIAQEQVDAAPPFTEVLVNLEAFLVKHGLIEEGTRKRLKRFCWCSDGPWDIRDFVVKQCFISKVEMPTWIQGDVLDVRHKVLQWINSQPPSATVAPANHKCRASTRPSLNIPAQLKALGLPAFEGRQHSGIDDTRNIARIVTELAHRGVHLLPNTAIYPGRRWRWMGKHGQILEDGLP